MKIWGNCFDGLKKLINKLKKVNGPPLTTKRHIQIDCLNEQKKFITDQKIFFIKKFIFRIIIILKIFFF